MLDGYNHHLWSPTGLGSSFVAPDYYADNSYSYGGSNAHYAQSVVSEDLRVYLPFWGSAGGSTGGCCHATQSGTDGSAWGRAYSLDVHLGSTAPGAGMHVMPLCCVP